MSQENLYTPDSIRTVSGIYVNVMDPKPEMFIIEDIAHALAHTPRFGGHLPHFYSVAEHSASVCHMVDAKELKLQALLHDAAEAYLCDIPSPIKKNLPDYKAMEQRLLKILLEKFGVKYPLHESVKDADACKLSWEWHNLMLGNINTKRIGWDFDGIKKEFLYLYEHYKGY